jgi:hypothetical protein
MLSFCHCPDHNGIPFKRCAPGKESEPVLVDLSSAIKERRHSSVAAGRSVPCQASGFELCDQS